MTSTDKLYAINVYGWLMVTEAANAREALSIGRDAASGASLLRSDVTPGHVRLATEEDVAQWQAMGGGR